MATIAVGSGLAAQIIAADEGAYGVAASLASPHCYEFRSETIELKKTAVQGEGLAAGKLYERTRRRVLTQYDVSGAITLDAPTRQLGFWIRYMLGDFADVPAQIGSTGIYKTVFQPCSTLKGRSFTLQKGVPTADNAVVEPVTEVGCKLSSWQLKVSTGAIAEMTLNIDARNELAGAGNSDPLNGSVPALGTFALPTAPSGSLPDSVFHFKQATLYTGGTPTLSAGVTIAGAPAVPTSGNTATNTFGQYALVTITAGTAAITAVTVNGAQVGTGAGAYLVPPNGTIAITYTSGPPTWTWAQAVVSLVGETVAAQVKDATVGQAFAFDNARMFLGSSGFKSEPIENGYRKISGSFLAEWQSSEAWYNAFAADSTTSLELQFTGASVSTSNYALDVIIPNIKLEGETPKVGGPAVVTQQLNFIGLDDETTVPIQVTYQSEDTAI